MPPKSLRIAPIPGLAVCQGLYCTHCPLASSSHEVMRKHLSECHDDIPSRNRTHIEGLMQQYNASTNRQWFRVFAPERAEAVAGAAEDFRKANYRILDNKGIDPDAENNVHNVNSWLRHCQYHLYTKGLDKDEAIARAASISEKELAPLNDAVDEYISQCEKYIDIAHVNILQRLNSEDPLTECVVHAEHPRRSYC